MAKAGWGSREYVLGLLSGQELARVPCFSGSISVTTPGLKSVGLRFNEVHCDPEKMAIAAATTYRLFGFESAVVPLDMCVEAEALGSTVDFRLEETLPMFPAIQVPVAAKITDLELPKPSSMSARGRIPIVLEAIRLLKQDVGIEVAVAAWIPGPFTLAMHLIQSEDVLVSAVRDSEVVGRSLDLLTDLMIEVAMAYHIAGADFITIHEMGGSPGYLGPAVFHDLVMPRLQRLVGMLPSPCVLNICGDTNRVMPMLADVGADAISVDQMNDLSQSRIALGSDILLFGNIDPVGVLARGSPANVIDAVCNAVDKGVDAVWPGCDLWPEVPAENMKALVSACRYGRQPE